MRIKENPLDKYQFWVPIYIREELKVNPEAMSYSELARFADAFEKLPDNIKWTVYYHFMLKLKDKDLAKLMGIKENTVKENYEKSINMIKEKLNEQK